MKVASARAPAGRSGAREPGGIQQTRVGGCEACDHKFLGRLDMREKLWPEQARGRRYGFERAHTAQYLAAIVTCHPNGGDLSGPLVDV